MRCEEIDTLVRRRLEQEQIALADARFLLAGSRSAQSIVNRAYYAMFYAVLALLQKTGRVPSKHSGAISLFDTGFVLRGLVPKQLSRDLHKAFEARQIADYKVVESVSIEKAEETLKNAEHFVQTVSAYLGSPEAPSEKT